MKIISLLVLILALVGYGYSVDPIIKSYKKPIINTYASNTCTVRFDVLIQYDVANSGLQSIINNNVYQSPYLVNGSLSLFALTHTVNIGKNQSVSFQLIDYNVYPAATWDFNNYATIDCDPIPSNLTMIAKQSSWVSTKGQFSTLTWLKMFEVPNLDKSLPGDAFTCTVPQPFYCYVFEFFNGAKITNYLVQIAVIQNNVPYVPFNVVITDKQGKVLHSSPFDGLNAPANPPVSISSLSSYPSNNSTVIKGEMLNNAFYLINILNKNSLCNIASTGDYFIQNTLTPVYGSPANATYIGFTSLHVQSPLNSHIQIVDTQGIKRVGSDNIVFINEKSYDNSVNNVRSTISFKSDVNSNVINAKAETSYNPNIYISNINSFLDFRINLNYPFGYSNGSVQYHTISVSLPIPNNIQSSNNTNVIINSPNDSYPVPGSISNTLIDNQKSQLLKVELVQVSFEKVILRVHAIDNGSGLSSVNLDSYQRMRSSDLVYGDQFDGVYEVVQSFDSYYGTSKPSIALYDNANNFQNFFDQYFDTNFNSIPEYPMSKYIKDQNLNPFNFTAFEFKYNDIDVSNGQFNNTICFNFENSDKKMTPRFMLVSSPLNTERFAIPNAIPGAWNDVKSMFCVDFTIPARAFTGEVLYAIIITPFVYDSYYLASSSLGSKAQLRVTSSFGDQMPPVITEFAAYPSNNVQVTQNTNIGWNIRIEDSPNGLLSAEFNITSDYDLQPYTIKITPSNATSGNSNSGTYQLRIPINSNTCRSQSFRISSASITDSQGHTSILPSNLNLNPLYRFLDSPQLILNITCPQAVVDNSPPTLTNFTSSVDTIDVGTYKDFRNITFTIKTSDSGSGISSRHNPIVYLNSNSFDQISQVSTLLSNSNGISTYTATVQLPYGYGSYQGILISIYGIVDNQLNINGYSSTDLQSLGFQSSIKVTYSNSPVLDTTSSINSTGTSLTIYGHKFGIDQSKLTLQIDYQNNQGWKNTSISFFSGIILMTNSITPTSTPFYVRVIVDGKVSNSLLVVPSIIDSPCKYEVLQSVVATWINSEKYHYLQASITIKNIGSRPIKLFSYVMDNIDQIWGVTVNGNRYTLPSYNEIINPYDQYSFGYIIKGTTVGELSQITYTCL